MIKTTGGKIAFELHTHTAESSPCARRSAADMMQMYFSAGYGGAFVTDHLSPYAVTRLGSPNNDYFNITISWEELIKRYMRGFEMAQTLGGALGMHIFMGTEICLESGPEDYLVLGTSRDFLLSHPHILSYSLPQLKKAVNDAGLFLVQAHPCREYLTLQKAENLDGLEVYNGNQSHNSHNDKTLKIAHERGCIMYSGSDSHSERDIARGGMWLPAAINDGYTMAHYIADNYSHIKMIKTVP